ncbi:MAG TPA: DUF3109 family protein [Bacteroidota bacterium]
MFLIQETIVDGSIATTKFACDLERCKGACCTLHGGRGAPLLESELDEIRNAFPAVKKYLSEKHLQTIETHGLFEGGPGDYSTACVDNRACVFVTYEHGIARCSFEKAYLNGEVSWRKPSSCHLFPIRVDSRERKHLRYEFLAECAPALERGEREGIFLSDFLDDALTRELGNEWYTEFSEYCRTVRQQEFDEQVVPHQRNA